MKKISLLLFLCLAFPVIAAKNATNFELTGVTGDVLLNIQHRLNEIYQNKPISNEDPETLKMQVTKALYPFGYFRPEVTLNYHQNKVFITIKPGPPIHISSLHIYLQGSGAEEPALKKALAALPIHKGEVFNNKNYEDAKDLLLTTAENEGYLHAVFQQATVKIDLQSYRVDIHLIFDTGTQYHFGTIYFDSTSVCPELLSRYVPFHYGEPYSTDKILALNNQLSASGYFKSVIVKPEVKQQKDVPIYVHFQKVDKINYSYSLGYGTDTGPRGRVGMHIIPVNKAGHKFNAIAQGSMKENAVLAQYSIPGRNPVADKFTLTGSFANLNYSSGNSNSVLLSLAQQHALNYFQRTISLNALHESYDYTNEPANHKSLLFPKINLTWRQVSDPLFSPSGYNFSIMSLAAHKILLSEVNLAQASIDGKIALMVEPIRTRFFLHGIQGFTGISHINNLPLSLALLLGGSENLKGYGYDSIGPGRIQSFAGIEIQKETFSKWYLIGFYDTGDVYKPSPREFKHDVGISLMWVSPVGPIKVGVAQAVDDHFRRVPDRNPRLVVNMGPDI